MDKNLKIIKTIVNKELPNSEVLLFGSRALGTNRKDSDYDIFILTKKALDQESKINSIGNIISYSAKQKIDTDVIIASKEEIKSKGINHIYTEALSYGKRI